MNLRGGWRFLRHRSERVDPNATKSAKSVLNSIMNGFEQEDLINVCDEINYGPSDSSRKRGRSEEDNQDNVRK